MKARSAAKVLTTLAVSVAALTGPLAPAASATDVYGIANGCYALKESYSGKYVVRAGNNYTATAATAAAATPFRLQATALGRYLLYGPGGAMPAVSLLGQVQAATKPGPTADWRFEYVSKTLRLVNVSNGNGLSVNAAGQLIHGAGAPVRWNVVPAQGCATFPEIQVNVTGTPLKGATPTSPVRGFFDDHIHLGAYEFLGGRFHCGRPWSPYGVTAALRGLRRPLPQRRGRGVRELPLRRQPGGNPLDRGMAQLRRLAARRVTDA